MLKSRVQEWSKNAWDQSTKIWDAEETINIASLFMEEIGLFWINPVPKKLANFWDKPK